MRPDTVAQHRPAGRWRLILLLALMIGLIVWWLGSYDHAPVAQHGAAPSAPAAPPEGPTQRASLWETEIAKDPFGARDWPRGSAQGWLPPALSAEPMAVAPTAAISPLHTSAPQHTAPPRPAATGDNAPGIGLEPAPQQQPE